MTEIQPPVVAPAERPFTELRQVTVTADEQIESVNRLLAEDWRLVSIGYRPDGVVYVLGRTEEKPKHRAGFLTAD